jgi:hypothetical protein
MSPHHHQQSPEANNTFPSLYSYRVGTKQRFIPFNMREGCPARLIRSAITLSTWAKGNAQDIDSFLAFESAFCLLADDLDNAHCPHNTIVKIFYSGFRKNDLAQFHWFLCGFPFPCKFSHPLAHQERHAAAEATFPQLLEDDDDLHRYLFFCGADEISMAIGIDFMDIE